MQCESVEEEETPEWVKFVLSRVQCQGRGKS
jgi:hypothetical protein